MASLLARTSRYLGAWLNEMFSERADPRIQVRMALEETRKRHRELTEQAAAVVASERELEIKTRRADEELERLRAAAVTALRLSEEAQAAGDSTAAARHEQTARLFAVQISAVSAAREQVLDARERASLAAAGARKAIELSAQALQSRLADASRLMTEIEVASMQERVADALAGLDGQGAFAAVPGLDEIRARTDHRLASAAARTNILEGGADVRMLEVERAAIESAGTRELDKIRGELRLPGQ